MTPINHLPTFTCVMAERDFLEALGGTCHSPVAAQASIDGGRITLKAEILNEDGSEKQQGLSTFAATDTAAPVSLARQLLDAASPALRALFEG